MKALSVLACGLLVLCSALPLVAQGGGEPPAALVPGPEHECFQKMAGTWEVTSKWWMDPTGEPNVSKGTAEFKLLFDGRFLMQEFKGVAMELTYTRKK